MRMTEENVLRAEHQMLTDTCIWESMDDDRQCHSILAYISGIHDMACALIDCIRELK